METRFCMHVANFDETRRFYEEGLGWKVYKEWSRSAEDRGVVYHAGTALLELLLAPAEKASRLNESFYLYIEVENLEDIRNSVLRYGSAATAIESYPWGHRSFIVKDPAGLSLKFFRVEI